MRNGARTALALALAVACTRDAPPPRRAAPSPAPAPVPVTGSAWVEGDRLRATGRVLTASGAPATGVSVTLRPVNEGTAFDALFAIAPGGHCVATDCSGQAAGRTGKGGRYALSYLDPDTDGAEVTVRGRDGSRARLSVPSAGGLPDLRLWAPRISPRWDGPSLALAPLRWPEGEVLDRGVVVRDADGAQLLATALPLDVRLAGARAATWAPFARVRVRTADGGVAEVLYEGPPARVPFRGTPLAATCTVLRADGRRLWSGRCGARDAPDGARLVVDLGRARRVGLVVASRCDAWPRCTVEWSGDGRAWRQARDLHDVHDRCECIVSKAAMTLDETARYLRLTAGHEMADPPRDMHWAVSVWGG